MFHVLHRFWRWLLARLGYCGGAHFLAGAPSLPPPLTPEQEKVLLSRMAAGDAAARDDLITHNLRLVVYLAKKYESSGVPAEDMISIGTIGLIKAVNTFTPERSIKLATYASRCIGNEILMYLRKSSNRRQEASIDEPLNVDGDGNESFLIFWAVMRTRSASGWSRMRSALCFAGPWTACPRGNGRSWSCALVWRTALSAPRRRPPTHWASAKATFPGWKNGSSIP